MGAQTWEAIKDFFDTAAGAACVGSMFVLLLAGSAYLIW